MDRGANGAPPEVARPPSVARRFDPPGGRQLRESPSATHESTPNQQERRMIRLRIFRHNRHFIPHFGIYTHIPDSIVQNLPKK